MKASLCTLAVLVTLAGCTGNTPDTNEQGLAFESDGQTHQIKRACTNGVVLDYDDASNPVVLVSIIDSPECSGAIQEFTESHVGGKMSTRFNDQYLVRDADVYSAIQGSFRFRVATDNEGKEVVEYYR